MTAARNASEPSESNGAHDTRQKLYMAKLREELQAWASVKFKDVWNALDSKASKSTIATIITIGLVLVGVFSGGIAYVAGVDKQVTRNTTKIESIEQTLTGQNEILREILSEVKKK